MSHEEDSGTSFSLPSKEDIVRIRELLGLSETPVEESYTADRQSDGDFFPNNDN